MYHGGFAALAGLSAHVHALDFDFVKDEGCASFELKSGAELAEYARLWRTLSADQRAKAFKKRANGPPEHMRSLCSLADFSAMCENEPDKPIALYLGAPLGAVASTFKDEPLLSWRVCYVAAMSGSWEGSKNLFGVCFNNAVVYEASKVASVASVSPSILSHLLLQRQI